MNATGLPLPSISPSSPPATEAGASIATVEQAPTDFVLALAQLLGTSAPATQAAATSLSPATTDEADPNAALDSAALAVMPLPLVPIQRPAHAGAAAAEADPLELLGLNPRAEGASARDLALLQAMTERLANLDAEAPAEISATASPTHLPAIDPQQPVRTTSDGAVQRTVHVPVGAPGWAEEIGSRLTLMTHKGDHSASLRLSPEHLGPLEIRITMREDQASVWFGAAHADTRAAIEQALPRLREMFSAQGMALADAGVFHESPRQQAPVLANDTSAAAEATDEPAAVVAQVKVGLLDAYA